MKKYILTPLAGIALLLMGLLFACDDQEAPHNTAPVLTTGSVEVGGRTTATLSGTIAFPDETEVTRQCLPAAGHPVGGTDGAATCHTLLLLPLCQ